MWLEIPKEAEVKSSVRTSCRTKVPRIVRIFAPNFAPNFPNLLRLFFFYIVLRFVGTETRNILPKIPTVFHCKLPRQTQRKNKSQNFPESRQTNKLRVIKEKWIFLQKHAFSLQIIHFPTEKCTFMQKHALSCRKMAISCRKMQFLGGRMAGNRRKLQEGGFQGTISQER